MYTRIMFTHAYHTCMDTHIGHKHVYTHAYLDMQTAANGPSLLYTFDSDLYTDSSESNNNPAIAVNSPQMTAASSCKVLVDCVSHQVLSY